MTAKELILIIVEDRITDLEREIKELKENLDDKERELERLYKFIDSYKNG